MSDKNDISKNFKCNICNKIYASNSSLWNHTNKYHNPNINQLSTNINQTSTNINQISNNINQTSININQISNNEIKKYECKNCYKQFNSIQARWKHNKKCIEIKTDNKSEFEEFKNTILELLQQDAKNHPKPLQKNNNDIIINKKLDVINTNIDKIKENIPIKYGIQILSFN